MRSLYLLDLHQNLLINICRVLAFRDKLQLRLVCKGFRSLLDDPAPGSGIWGAIDLYDFKAKLPQLQLYRWLLKRAAGIQSLLHAPPGVGELSPETEITGSSYGMRGLIMQIIPRLASILPRGAELLLDLRWATAQCLFARAQAPHNPEYMFQYWGALSSCLTKLKVAFNEDVAPETSSAMNQLTQLKGLLLEGFNSNDATIHLQLPQLTKLTLHGFANTNVSLDCLQLESLKLIKLNPLLEMSRLPEGIERLRLDTLAAGSMPFEQMLPAQGIKHLSHLKLHDCPGNPTAVRKASVASKVVALSIDYPWAPLLPSQPPWQGLPCHLQHILLKHPLDNGIPLVLEQLSNLRTLTMLHVGDGPVHLTRPLDPFLDMANLRILHLYGDTREEYGYESYEHSFDRWTPAALGLLALAERRALRVASVKGGRPIALCQ